MQVLANTVYALVIAASALSDVVDERAAGSCVEESGGCEKEAIDDPTAAALAFYQQRAKWFVKHGGLKMANSIKDPPEHDTQDDSMTESDGRQSALQLQVASAILTEKSQTTVTKKEKDTNGDANPSFVAMSSIVAHKTSPEDHAEFAILHEERLPTQAVLPELDTGLVSTLSGYISGFKTIIKHGIKSVKEAVTKSLFPQADTDDLSESAYKLIQDRQSTMEMMAFIKKLVKEAGGQVPDESNLQTFAVHFSGERSVHAWPILWEDLVARGWMPHGSDAAFTEAGYHAVATRRSHQEMADFIRRLITANGGRVLNNHGLDGFVLFYSGEQAVQTLGKMQDELIMKAAKEGWLETRSDSTKAGASLLVKDELFGGAEWQEDSSGATTVAEGCHKSFHGNGLDCTIEYAEHELVRKWIPENATVMEFGARFGTTTCEIAKKLANSGRLVAIEPDRSVWRSLAGNLRDNNCHAHLLRGAVSSKPLRIIPAAYATRAASDGTEETVQNFTFDAVEEALGLTVDTLLIDCEGCAEAMLDQIGPKIEKQVNLIILEADIPHVMNYEKFIRFLNSSGFDMVDQFNDCDRTRVQVPPGSPCYSMIEHYAFKRRIKITQRANTLDM